MPEEPKGNEKKWDWDVIQALYMGGMELTSIIRIPKYRELSLKYLQKNATKGKWYTAREAARAEGVEALGKSLMARFQEAENDHQHWLLDTLETERRIFERTKSKNGGKEQLERLNIIDKIDATARRQLKLDDRAPLTDQARNLGILLHISTNPPRLKALPGTMTIEAAEIVVSEGGMSAAQLEAAKLMEAYGEEASEKPEKVLPPGIKVVAGPNFGPPVNEKPNAEPIGDKRV